MDDGGMGERWGIFSDELSLTWHLFTVTTHQVRDTGTFIRWDPIVRMSTLRLPAGWLDKEMIFSFQVISEGCLDSLSHWSADEALKGSR